MKKLILLTTLFITPLAFAETTTTSTSSVSSECHKQIGAQQGQRETPPEPPKDSNGKPLPPPDGFKHGQGQGQSSDRPAPPEHKC